MDGQTAAGWLIHVAVVGGLLLLLTTAAMAATRSPARRQRLGEWGLLAALVLAVLSAAPPWLPLPWWPTAAPGLPSDNAIASPGVPEEPHAAAPAASPTDFLADASDNGFAFIPGFDAATALAAADVPALESEAAPAAPAVAAEAKVLDAAVGTAAQPIRMEFTLLATYLAGAVCLLCRHLLGHLALARLLRRSTPASERVKRLLSEMREDRRGFRVRLSSRIPVPFSCGLLRPTIVLPADLAASAPDEVLRWVLVHEATHAERRDAWGCLLAAWALVVYYPLPWLWWLRRQVRLCQEYVADAAAAGAGPPEDYAQFLLSWASAPALPGGATGVSGRTSDLYRRISMLLKNRVPVEQCCPRRWMMLTAGSLLSLAVLGAGLGRPLMAAPAPDPDRKEAPKDDAAKKEPKNDRKQADRPALPGLPPGVNLDDLIRGSGLSEEQVRNLLGVALKDDDLKKLMEERDRVLREVQELLQNRGLPGGVGGLPGAPGRAGLGIGQPLMAGASHAIGDRRLGVGVSKPSPTLVEQLDLPKGQGLILDEVAPDSAAAKAGLKPHDILLELDGKPVSTDPAAFVRQLQTIEADKAIEAVVLRRGKRETIKGVKLPEARAGRAGARNEANPLGGLFPGIPGAPVGGFGGAPGGFPAGGFGGAPGPGLGIGFGGAVGNGVMTTTFRTDDRFTTRHQEGSLIITLSGKVVDGKAKVGDVSVQDGRESHKYESMDKVPEAYRDKAKHLMDLIEKDGVRIEIKRGDGSR